MNQQIITEPEFKELEQRLKYDWFLLKLYSMFQELSRRSIETGFWLKKILNSDSKHPDSSLLSLSWM